MKKKLFCLMAAALMVFGLAACGGKDAGSGDSGKSDFEAFMEVQKNMADLKDVEFKMSMDMDLELSEEEKMSTTLTGTCKEVIKAKDDVEMEMNYDIDIPMMETKTKATAYMKDGIAYMDLEGSKIKVDSSSEMASMTQAIDTEEMLNISQEMVSDLQVKKDGGNTVYSFKIDPTKALDYFNNNTKGYEEVSSALQDVTFDHMNVVITADDKQMVQKMDMDCAMTSKVEGDQTMNLAYKLSAEFVSINTGLTIDFPDFSDYEELSL